MRTVAALPIYIGGVPLWGMIFGPEEVLSQSHTPSAHVASREQRARVNGILRNRA